MTITSEITATTPIVAPDVPCCARLRGRFAAADDDAAAFPHSSAGGAVGAPYPGTRPGGGAYPIPGTDGAAATGAGCPKMSSFSSVSTNPRGGGAAGIGGGGAYAGACIDG